MAGGSVCTEFGEEEAVAVLQREEPPQDAG